jgi:predicted nuclease of predicted toxin-antitoxin system
MKLLLDENLPHQLRLEIPGHQCITVAYMGWAGIENGDLLSRAESANFEAVVTKDANLEYESNLVNLPIAVVVLHAPSNDIDDIRPLLPRLLEALTSLPPKQVTHVL